MQREARSLDGDKIPGYLGGLDAAVLETEEGGGGPSFGWQ